MFRHKNQTYYFRIQIPTDLRKWFSNREDYAQSLKTKSKADASRAHALIEELWRSAFYQIRYHLIEPSKIPALVEQLLSGRNQVSPPYLLKPSLNPSLASESLSPIHSAPLSTSMTLAQLIQVYTAEHLPTWTTRTSLEFKSIFKLLVRIIGDVHVPTIDRMKCIALRDVLINIPPGHGKTEKYRGMSIEELIAIDAQKLHPKTVNKHLQLLSGLFRWAVRNRYMEHNSCEGLSLEITAKPTDERLPFDDDDIAKICSALPPIEGEPTSWIPFVAMYSGLRVEEICRLRAKDILCKNGVYLYDINNDVGRLKTKNSVRYVPIHIVLINMGLILYVNTILKENNLWGLRCTRYGWSKMYTKKFGWFLRKHAKISDKRKCFHSFRHSFSFKLKTAGVNDHLISQLMGHANGDISTNRYGADYPFEMAYDAISLISYRNQIGE